MQRYVNLRLYRHIKSFPDSQYYIGLSEHPDLTLETIIELPEYPWEWDTLDTHHNFTFEWIERFPDKPWGWLHLHNHSAFSFEWVERFPDKEWSWLGLSRIASVRNVKRYPHFPWDWITLTVTSDIQPADMVHNPQFPWRVDLIEFNAIEDEDLEFLYFYKDSFTNENWESFTEVAPWEIIKKTMDLYWSTGNINFDSIVFTQEDMDFFRVHDDSHAWNWSVLSIMVPYDLIRANRDLPWNYTLVSLNHTVTYDEIVSAPDMPWDMINTPCEPIDRTIRRWVAASTIKRRYKRAISDPSYLMCRRRLENEFKNLCASYKKDE